MKNKKTAVLKWAALAVFLLLAGCFYSCGGRKNPQMTLSGQNGRGFAAETAPRKTLEQGGNAGQSNAGRRESGQSGAGQEPEIGETRDAAEISEPPNGAETSESVQAAEAESSAEALCYVYVCGEVQNPGVYQLAEGARIFEAVSLAGGFTAEAAQNWLNLADMVSDGMKLEVPSKTQVTEETWLKRASENNGNRSAQAEGSSTVRVNINTASKEELMTLKGIGASRADDIIRYREENGGFPAIEDIMKVPGIKNAAFQKIKENITV